MHGLVTVVAGACALAAARADVAPSYGDRWGPSARRYQWGSQAPPLEWASDWADNLEHEVPLGPFDLVCLGGVVMLAYHYAGQVGRRPTSEVRATWQDLCEELLLPELHIKRRFTVGHESRAKEKKKTKKKKRRGRAGGDDGSSSSSSSSPASSDSSGSIYGGQPEDSRVFRMFRRRTHRHKMTQRIDCSNREDGRTDLLQLMRLARQRPEMLRAELLRFEWEEEDIATLMRKIEELGEGARGIQAKAHAGAAFARFDANGDGTITQQELAHVLQRLDPETWTAERAQALFRAMDANHDKHIDYSEFVEFIFAAGTGIRGSGVDEETRQHAHEAIAGAAEVPAERTPRRATQARATWRKETGTDRYVYRVRSRPPAELERAGRPAIAVASLEAGVVAGTGSAT